MSTSSDLLLTLGEGVCSLSLDHSQSLDHLTVQISKVKMITGNCQCYKLNDTLFSLLDFFVCIDSLGAL